MVEPQETHNAADEVRNSEEAQFEVEQNRSESPVEDVELKDENKGEEKIEVDEVGEENRSVQSEPAAAAAATADDPKHMENQKYLNTFFSEPIYHGMLHLVEKRSATPLHELGVYFMENYCKDEKPEESLLSAPETTLPANELQSIKEINDREYLDKYVCTKVQFYLFEICSERPNNPHKRFAEFLLTASKK
ncbi:MAG: hypothetical protein MHMPM18_000378 [Marteilia pararefringens]